jgi:hypothetical protein
MATSNGILFDIKNLKNRRCGAFPHFQKKKKNCRRARIDAIKLGHVYNTIPGASSDFWSQPYDL